MAEFSLGLFFGSMVALVVVKVFIWFGDFESRESRMERIERDFYQRLREKSQD